MTLTGAREWNQIPGGHEYYTKEDRSTPSPDEPPAAAAAAAAAPRDRKGTGGRRVAIASGAVFGVLAVITLVVIGEGLSDDLGHMPPMGHTPPAPEGSKLMCGWRGYEWNSGCWAHDYGQARWAQGVIHAATDEWRAAEGRTPLGRDLALDAVAQAHAEGMAAHGFFAHVTPGGLDPTDRAELLRYNCQKRTHVGIGENINMFEDWPWERAAHAAVPSWMESPGHRENILAPDYDRMGVGFAIARDGTIYAVQNFC